MKKQPLLKPHLHESLCKKKHVCLYWDVLGVLFFLRGGVSDVTSTEATKLAGKVEET